MELNETVDVHQIVSGFHERMSKVALFDPLFELQRKKQTDLDGASIDMMELGLLALLYFFEQKLMRNPKAGAADLAVFLRSAIAGRFRMNGDAYEDLARSIIQVFRPASGRKRSFSFYNWETRGQDTVYTSILKTSAFDTRTNTQYYALDEDGLELVFATKEFYLEFQLSIHQLVLRKQLEKGEFQGALRQINEMRVDVEALQERMMKLAHEIKRSIVSEETLKKYGTLLDDIYSRLHRENEEFEELRDFVKETRDRIYSDTLQTRQPHAYEYILRISSELEKVHGEHTLLLQRSMELKTGALQAAKESLYYTGMDSFNFDQDIASFIFGSPLPLVALEGVLSPFMGLEHMAAWSPLTIFAEQNIAGDGEEDNRDEAFLEAADPDRAGAFAQQRGRLFAALMKDMLEVLRTRTSVYLSDILNLYRQDSERALWLDKRAFYDFWLILHQRSPIRSKPLQPDVEERPTGMEEALRLLGDRTLVLVEEQGILQVNDRYAIQEMKLRWGDVDDAL
ncbi:replicative DNA helicase [Paenibacillus sp. y28]|uniref:replicative DNA helicase n=1 Tax=Paenibacillus sp. y28 TaxID=3129110 RepID=UPI0030161B76